MANHKSAKKRARQNEKRRIHNKAQRSIVRTLINQLRQALHEKEKNKATNLLLAVQSHLAKLAGKGILKKKTAARTTSRLTTQTNRL